MKKVICLNASFMILLKLDKIYVWMLYLLYYLNEGGHTSEWCINGIIKMSVGICLKVLYMCISSRVEILCLLYKPATLISKKVDCPYWGRLLRPFWDVSALTLQNDCNKACCLYYIQLHRKTPFVLQRKRDISVAERWGTYHGYCSSRVGTRSSV
jgi:hypothetical protein